MHYTKIFSEIKNIAKIKALEFIDLKFVTLRLQLSYSLHDFTNLQTKTSNFQEFINQSDCTDKKPNKHRILCSPDHFKNCWKFRTRQWKFVKPCVEQLKTLIIIRGVSNQCKAGKTAALPTFSDMLTLWQLRGADYAHTYWLGLT